MPLYIICHGKHQNGIPTNEITNGLCTSNKSPNQYAISMKYVSMTQIKFFMM